MPLDSTNFVEAKPDSQVVTDLLAVRKRIEREEDWCGDQIGGRRGEAMCLGYAMLSITGTAGAYQTHRFAAIEAAMGLRGSQIVDFNDTHTHAEVLDLIDRTIARERGA